VTDVAGLAPTRVPPGPKLPPWVLAIGVVGLRRRSTQWLRRRYGTAATIRIPVVGDAVVISDPALVKQLFMASTDLIGYNEPNLGIVLGKGSTFSLDGEEHRRRRKLLMPPFHGKRMRGYESIVEEETLREAATWPHGEEFPVLRPMARITVNVIVRTVFGAEGADLDELRELLPRMVETASKLAMVPPALQRDFGRFSPWGRFLRMRARYDGIVQSLIDTALGDANLDERSDVLALLLQARYDDGTAISHRHVADELLTLLAAGHETTATTLAWAVERLRRHPQVLSRLIDEVDDDGSEFRQATILEVQRTRPVIDGTARRVIGDCLPLGEWVVPHGWHVLVSILAVHEDDAVFPNAAAFDPDRFVGSPPDSYSWIPFGGGTRRCVGSAFANMEMDVVLRTLLRHYELAPSYRRDERWHSRGIAFAPGKGGLAVVQPRRTAERGGEGREVRSDDVRRTVQQVAR
jgi:hypothetical protein